MKSSGASGHPAALLQLERAVQREALLVNPLPVVIDKSWGGACRSRGVMDLTIMLGVSAIAALIIYWVAGPVES
jgi:hypothetical protein